VGENYIKLLIIFGKKLWRRLSQRNLNRSVYHSSWLDHSVVLVWSRSAGHHYHHQLVWYRINKGRSSQTVPTMWQVASWWVGSTSPGRWLWTSEGSSRILCCKLGHYTSGGWRVNYCIVKDIIHGLSGEALQSWETDSQEGLASFGFCMETDIW